MASNCIPLMVWKITKRVLKETGLEFEYLPNSCNVNWYQDGMESVDWHSDDESLFHSKYEDCLVISLSLGESKKLEIKLLDDNFIVDNNTNNVAETKTTQIILRHGDLMTM